MLTCFSLCVVQPINRERVNTPKGYWEHIENRHKFFTSIAAEHNFDPLDPHGWANVSYHAISMKQVLKKRKTLVCEKIEKISLA